MAAYRLLLWLYPASFRLDHGREMAAVFAESLRAAQGRPGAIAMLWMHAVADALWSGPAAHFELLRVDLRQAFRHFRRAPLFALTVVMVSALGIGATTATWSLLDHLLIRHLPYPEPERLIRLYHDDQSRGYSRMELSPGNFRDWRAESRSFAAMASYYFDSGNLGGVGDPKRLAGAGVSGDFFEVFGVEPRLGRVLRASDDAAGAEGALVISHHLWREVFAADSAAIGQAVRLNDEPFTVVGVMPPEFTFPNRETQYWKAQRFTEENYQDRYDCWIIGIGRLAPGVALPTASAELAAIAGRLAVAHPESNAKIGATLVELSGDMSGRSRLMVKVLFGASLSLLLIACANLASLLVARSLERQQELALRSALGAGRERLIRQLLTECLALALLGGLAGLGLAMLVTPLGVALVPADLPIAGTPTVDHRVLLFALLTTVVTGVGFGIAPSLRACREVSAEALREGQRAGQSVGKQRLRSALVTAEVALSLGLLVVAGLLGRALLEVREIQPGFESRQLVTLRTWLPHPRYEKEAVRHAFYSRVLERVEALPGVENAAFTSFLPLAMGGGIWKVEIPGQAPPEVHETASLRFVTPGYFDTLGIGLRAGRDLRASDIEGADTVAVVSESFAKRHWPGQDPLDRTFTFAFKPRRVVGVVNDVLVRGLERRSEPQVYLPARQQTPDGSVPFYDPKDLAIRTSLPLDQLIPEVRRIVHDADPEQAISDVRTMETLVEAQTASRQLQSRVLMAFAVAALLLAAIGVHGLLAFIVSVRRPELGVRLALGARAGDLVRALVAQIGKLALAGIAIGAVLGLVAGRLLESLLAGVHPADPLTFGLALAGILAAAMAGGLLPLLGVVRIDPAEVIRRG